VPGPAGEKHERKREDRRADREVHEEDPVPVEHVGDHPAEQDARGAAPREDEAEHPHRLRPLGRLDEQGHDQGERDRRDDGAAETLHRARRDELPLGAGETAGERRDREEADPREEKPAMTEQVAEPASQQKEAAERQQVCVHDPCERLLREPEVVADRRERDVHDRPVEDDHQIAEAEDEEREPASTGIRDRHRGVLSVLPLSVSRHGRREPRELIGKVTTSRLPSAEPARQWGLQAVRGCGCPHSRR
jgi:hypothetical protein